MGRLPGLRVGTSPIHGRGVFATRAISRGERIVEYVGERISEEEADARYDDDAMEHAHTFLFTVDDGTVIDGARGGNDARFINHSCAPNCEAVNEEGRIFIEALRDIAPGEELTYDYNLERGELTPGWRERYACSCGAPSCRGTLLAPAPAQRKARGGPARRVPGRN
jgi:hypothetical protein